MTRDEDRRQYLRIPHQVEVKPDGAHQFWTGISENISEGGLFVATDTLPRLGERLGVNFLPPGMSEPIHVSGIVRWLRATSLEDRDAPPGFGIEFLDLPAAVVHAIQHYICQNPPLFFEYAMLRGHKRMCHQVDVTLHQDDRVALGVSEVVSAGGALVVTDLAARPDDRLDIVFIPPGCDDAIRTASVVRYVRAAAPALGLEFLDLPTAVRQRIADFVDQSERSAKVSSTGA
jgi:uncharacterized protein (TIGR02266 family)